MVLDDIPEDAGLIIESTPSFYLDRFCGRDFDMVNMVSVPEGFEDGVSKTEDENILDRLFPQVMIDPVGLGFGKPFPNQCIQFFCRAQVRSKWFFNDHTGPGIPVRFMKEFCGLKLFEDEGEKPGRGCKVKNSISPYEAIFSFGNVVVSLQTAFLILGSA